LKRYPGCVDDYVVAVSRANLSTENED
jgi:hypothetical protein